jgi:hypothetical protein
MKLITLSILLASCASCVDQGRGSGPDVKVYISKPESGGIVRSQDNEVVYYAETLNFRCMNQEDFDELIRYCYDSDNKIVDQIRTKARRMSKRRKERFLKRVASEVESILIDSDIEQRKNFDNMMNKINNLQAHEI